VANGIDLTGRWTGIYFYPVDDRYNANDNLPATPFTADLTEAAGQITGATLETAVGGGIGRQIAGVVEGLHAGDELTFTKYPDNSDHVIRYTGSVSADGDSISGVWSIPDSWSGAFRMQRKPAPVTASLETGASVPRS